ncbi:MAG: CAP domain-containing protein [Patiriisocius sp.]|uniref:CAP domain-containing protein n=1 Tax=Patiriisocius sp. TaxID=2822396 RepID=UPI003EF8D52E
MRLLKTTLLAIVLSFSVASCSTEDTAAIEEANYAIDLNLAQETDWAMAEEILVLVNEHRATLGLAAIKKDQQYASAYAVDHTKYMIDLEEINHDNFHYRTEALKGQGAEKVGENVAFGYTDAQTVVTAWLNSDGHRRAIEGDFTHSGFGIIPNDRGTYYFTQLFYKR